MLKDYTLEDDECVICGKSSNYLPLCPSCYKMYKRYFNQGEDLSYCNKTLSYAMLRLFAYFDSLESDDIIDDKTGFLIDFALEIRPLMKNEFAFINNNNAEIETLKDENLKLKKEIETLKSNFIDEDIADPRKKWQAKYRCKDGHYVRSRAELLIDNWLYSENIIHIYEKQITFPNGEKRLCDFYLPDYKAYIEFWGNIDDYYIKRKNDKVALYNTLTDVKLIQLDEKSLENLDDILEEHIERIK